MANITNTTSSPQPSNEGWDAPRIFTAIVAAIYLTLAVVTLILFVRKLNQTCEMLNRQEDEARLLSGANSDALNNSHTTGIGGAAGGGEHDSYGGGAAGYSDATGGQYGPATRILSGRGDKQLQSEDFKRYYGGGGAAAGASGYRSQVSGNYHQISSSIHPHTDSSISRAFANHRPSFQTASDLDPNKQQHHGGGGAGGGGFLSPGSRTNINDVTRTSTIGSGLDYYSNNPGVAPSVSDVVVEVRSDPGSDTTVLTDRGGHPRPPRVTPRIQSRGACMSCFMTCMRPVFRFVTHCCCFPSSYFCDRNRSSLLLLGSMFFYSIARSAELTANTIDFHDANQGAATLYQTVVTAIPAICLVLLQVSFNLKWVTNVRNLSATGAPEGSRLSLGPSRSALSLLNSNAQSPRASGLPVDEDDPETNCSCDIGTFALASGVFLLALTPLASIFALIAYVIKPTDPQHPQDDRLNYFLGVEDMIWMKVVTGFFAVPYLLNGVFCIFLGFVLKTVWKPFSEVATKASFHMFLVAELWGGLCFVRGVLLLSYDLNTFNHSTHSPWAGPSVLVAEGLLIYCIVFIFYLVSRNQDQVVSAEKEARKRLERGGSPPINPNTVSQRGKGLTRPGEAEDTDSGINNNRGSSRGKLGTSASANDLYEEDSDGNLRPAQKKRRQAKGLDAAGGGSHLGSANQQGKGGTGEGLPVYSTWSSNSQTPSRAVSENFDHYHDHGGPSSTRASQVGNNPYGSNFHHHQPQQLVASTSGQQQQHQTLSQAALGGPTPPSTVTLNSTATNDSRLGAMSQTGQPTQSRLFYDD